MTTYRRLKLPHLHPPGATFSVLLLVEDAIPSDLMHRLKIAREKELLQIKGKRLPGWQRALGVAQLSHDRELDRCLRLHASQEHPLAHPEAAQLMVDRIKTYDGKYYDLYAYSVLSNHVHLELDFSLQLPDNWQGEEHLPNYVNLAKVMNLIKGGSARYINQVLGRTGNSLWTNRYRDRFIRNEAHLLNACSYTKLNPQAAGLVTNWRDHPFTGGMSEEALAERRHRRVYPSAELWISRLLDFDAGVREVKRPSPRRRTRD